MNSQKLSGAVSCLAAILILQQIRSLPRYAKEPWNLQTEENA